MAKIQVIGRQNSGCDYFRCVLPAIYLQKDIKWCENNTIEMLWIAQDEWQIDCDILIYNKLIFTPIQVLKDLQSKGMKIIVDVDDYWVLPPSHINSQWNSSGNDKLTLDHIRIADVVTCTSLRLQEEIRKHNKNTVVIPNAFPFGDGVFKRSETIHEGNLTRFIYAGGVSHLPDIELLRGKFKRIGSDNFIRNNAEFILAGYDKAKQKKYYTNKDQQEQNNNYEIIDARGPYDTMTSIFAQTRSHRVLSTLHVTEYLKHYDQADVALVPMVESSWNSMKSILKILEAATREIPVICSNVAPYSDLRPCEGIMFVESPDNWIEYIRKCIKEPEWTKEQGKNLANWIKAEYDLVTWNETRKELFKNLAK